MKVASDCSEKQFSMILVPRIHRIGLLGILSICLLLMIQACSSGTIREQESVWTESFDSNHGWLLSDDASATVNIEDGVLKVEVYEPGQVAWAAHESVWKNFELTVTTEQLSGPIDNEYGVLVRMDNDTSFYVLSISGDGYARAALYQDEGWTVLGNDWTLFPHIQQGLSANTLSVTAQDTSLSLTVNGETVFQVDDATLSKGSIGLYAGAFGEGGVVITFDDLEVTSLP